MGRRTGNVGITRFQVRRSLRDPIGYAALVEVVNASDEPVECRLDLELNGEPVDVVPLTLPADGRWSRTFEKASAEGGRLVARIDRPDTLTADNEATALLPRRELRRVLLVTKGSWFLEKVFEACPLVDPRVINEPPAVVPSGTIAVFHRVVPARLPAGPVFVIDPAGSCDWWQLGDRLPTPIIARQDRDAPVMAHVFLDRMPFPDARKLELKVPPGVPVQRLAATATDDPVFWAVERRRAGFWC